MQPQLKPCGDTSTPNRHPNHHRSFSKKSNSKGNASANGPAFLATDVTTLDINTMFHAKKSKRHTAPATPTLGYYGAHGANHFNFPSYLNPASLYNNMDIVGGNGDLPPLMSVPAYKPASLLHGLDPASALDFAQFTEELNALQNYPMYPNNQNALQSLFAADPHSSSAFLSSAVASHLSKQPSALTTASPRSVGGRKNRMVEVKMVNDRPVVIVSDPQAASSSARSSIVQLNRNVLGVLKGLESAKKQEISEEPLYSRKVFIGGLPIDVTEEEVWATFGYFGKVLVDWPRRPEHGGRGDFFEVEMGRRNLSGYVFLVFQEERAVQQLVNACEYYDKKYYLQLSSPTMADKAVQVRAWKLSDIDYFADENAMVDHRKTVFIGGVPRPTRASDLARCLQEHYGKVSYVGIDIDPELRYPKGAARVTFATAQSFVRAISGRFVQVTHADTNKRVEIKPYVMEDQYCDECEGKLCKHNYAPYFCGDPSCLQYYCEACWDRMHYQMCVNRADHRPMVRTGDQTRVLPRPPHHNSQQQFHNHHRSSRHQNIPTSPQMDHSPHHQSSTSMISRIINRNHNNNVIGGAQKPFSAVPTAIGY